MQARTRELSGIALDWAVAKCKGLDITIGKTEQGSKLTVLTPIDGLWRHFKPSSDWSLGGPIIEREGINLSFHHQTKECAATDLKLVVCIWGKTPLIAAMRCHVASKLGDVVDIPGELCLTDQ